MLNLTRVLCNRRYVSFQLYPKPFLMYSCSGVVVKVDQSKGEDSDFGGGFVQKPLKLFDNALETPSDRAVGYAISQSRL